MSTSYRDRMHNDLGAASGRVAAAAAQMELAGGPVALQEPAVRAACSPRQLQRDFDEVLGVAPRQHGAGVRTAAARRALPQTGSVSEAVSEAVSGAVSGGMSDAVSGGMSDAVSGGMSDAMHEAGYGSVRACYAEAACRLGMEPHEYARRAAGRTLLWSAAGTPFGEVIAVASADGLCAVRIGELGELLQRVREEFAAARLMRDDAAMGEAMSALQLLALGRHAPRLPVAAAGTAFQTRVWAALREIPTGQTRTYRQVAASIGSPQSARAVARACATNPVALAVPCHRVVRSEGDPAGYRWGPSVKVSLLDAERAAAQP